MHMSKKLEVLTISDDFMFGIIMRNPKYCKPFWETILNIKISRIEYPQDQKTINLSLDAKSIRLDVYVEDDSNTVYNIEHTVKTEFCNLCLHPLIRSISADMSILSKTAVWKIQICCLTMLHRKSF